MTLSPIAIALAAALLFVSPWAPAAEAHGAVYQPPRYGGPGDRPPGADPGGPWRPGDGAGRSGPRAPSGGGGRPSAPAGPPAAGPLVVRTGGDSPTSDPLDWRPWWDLQRRVLLGARSQRLPAAGPLADGAFLGRTSAGGAPFRPVSRAALREHVLPALLAAIEEDGSASLASASLLALARLADDLDEESAARAAKAIGARLCHPDQEVSETAALALGVLGRRTSVELLSSLVRDDAGGRRSAGRDRVPERTRTFAAYGLATLAAERRAGEPVLAARATAVFAETFARARGSATTDLAVACLLGAGRCGLLGADGAADPSAWLLSALEEPRADRLLRAHAAVALGWLALESPEHATDQPSERLLAGLRRAFRASDSPNELRRGAALALGRAIGAAGGAERGRAVDALRAADEHVADRPARAFARLALGRIAARVARRDPGEAATLVAGLVRDLARGRGGLREWSALALGLWAHGVREAGATPDAPALRALVEQLGSARSPSEIGALAVACALALPTGERVPGALESAWERAAGPGVREPLLTAAGRLGSERILSAARALLADPSGEPDLLPEAALAAVRSGAPRALEPLLERLASARSGLAQAAAARALGAVGDHRALGPLVRLLGDRTRPSGVRAFAAAALGLCLDPDPRAWSTLWADGVLYLDAPATLRDAVGRGLLDLL